MTIVMIGPTGDEVPIDDAGFIYKDPPADFEIEATLWNGGHTTSLDAICPCGNFHAMANACNGLVVVEKPLRHLEEILVLAKVFGSTTAGKKNSKIVFRVDFGKGEIGLNLISFPLLGDGPPRSNFVHHHLVTPLFWRNHHWLNAGLLEAVERIEGIDSLGGIANDNEGLSKMG